MVEKAKEKIEVVREIAKIDTTYNGRMSYIGLYIKEGQYGQFFSIEKHGEDMQAKYLSLTLNVEKIKEIGEQMIKFANEQTAK
jgi:hypothetical protein